VREDHSENGDAWNFFTHDHARSRAYRWGEDGIDGSQSGMRQSADMKSPGRQVSILPRAAEFCVIGTGMVTSSLVPR
jgi:hypothetical protein